MNDPVAPPPGLPPSYLRSPQRSGSTRDMHKPLLLWTGIAAIILILWGFATFFPGGGWQKTKIEGELVLFGALPTLGVYTHTFGIDYFAQVLPPNEDYRITAASLSPTRNHLALSVMLDEVPRLIVQSLTDTSEKVLYEGKMGEQLSAPVWSPDGTLIAYALVPTPMTDSKYRLFPSRVRLVSVTGESKAALSAKGVPIAISYKNDRLLMQSFHNDLSFVDLDGTVHTHDSLLLPPTTSDIALSIGGGQLAANDGVSLIWGSLDWDAFTFTRKAMIAGAYKSFVFAPFDDLLVFDGAILSLYRLEEAGEVQKLASRELTLMNPAKFLRWVLP